MNQVNRHMQNGMNIIQSLMLVAAMTTLLAMTGWMLGGLTLAVFAVGLTCLLYMFQPQISPYLLVRWSRLRPLSYSEAPRLNQIRDVLSKRAALERKPTLLYLPHRGMSAFTMGSQDNTVVAVSEGLLRHLSLNEITAVMAHEISHIRNGDMRMMGFADMTGRLNHVLSLFGQFLLLFNLPMILVGGYTVNWVAILLLIAAPTIHALLQLALSRTREYRADLGAAELTGNPESLASALMKIERSQKGIFRSMLWPVQVPRPEKSLWRSHPPTKERIRRLLSLNRPNPNPERRAENWLSPHHAAIPQIRRGYLLNFR